MRWLGLALMICAVAAAAAAWQIPLDPWLVDELITARTFPLVGAAVLGAGAILVALSNPPDDGDGQSRKLVSPLGLVAGALLLAAGVDWVGIWAAAGVMVGLGSVWLGERRPALILGGAAGFSLGLWLLVEVLLGIDMPASWLAG